MTERESPNVAGFEQLTPVAEGGFGSVYRALDEHIGRVVAIKVLDKVDTTDPRARDRFLREARAMGTLSGLPNIVDIYHATFTADGRPCLVMPYFAGGSLADLLSTRGRLPSDEVITLGATVARALDSAHRRGMSHRDIKPENILVDEAGEPGLADFGIAMTADSQASTRTRFAISPEHAPPERLNPPAGSKPPETLGDIYSLASTLYTLLAGHPPFGTETQLGSYEFIRRVVEQPPPPLTGTDIPPQLQTVLNQGLAKDPYARYATALDLATALETIEHTPTRITAQPHPAGAAVILAATTVPESGAVFGPTGPPSAVPTPSPGDHHVEPDARSTTRPREAGTKDHHETVYRDRAPSPELLLPRDERPRSPSRRSVLAIALVLLLLGLSALAARLWSNRGSDPTIDPVAAVQSTTVVKPATEPPHADRDGAKPTAALLACSPAQAVPPAEGKPDVKVPAGDALTEIEETDIKVGDGAEANVGDKVAVEYVGVAKSTGKEFDASWTTNSGVPPFEFTLSSPDPTVEGQVIKGIDQGVAGMKVGGRRMLIVPPALGYGEKGRGANIGPNETLIFVVDLVQVCSPTATAPDSSAPPATTAVAVGAPASVPPPPAQATITADTPCPAADDSAARTTKFANAPPMCIDPSKRYSATFDTNMGPFKVSLDARAMASTTNNFVVLSRYHYYDGTALFRLDPSIDIIQGGAATTNTASDPGPGYTIPDEGGRFTYKEGEIVMARTSQPNSSGAQFFLTSGPKVSALDSQGTYLAFGTVTEGLDLLKKIMATYVPFPADSPNAQLGGGPRDPVIINRITIGES